MKANQTNTDNNSTLDVGHRVFDALLPAASILHPRSSIVVSLLMLSLSAAHVQAGTGPAQTYSVLHNFTGSEGRGPGNLIASGAVLYGATWSGGASGGATIYRMNTNGSAFAVLQNCDFSIGYSPTDLLLAGPLLYGTLYYGGTNNGGIVFTIDINGESFTVLKDFTESGDGKHPTGLTLSGSTLYGTTSAGGTGGKGVVFKLETNGPGFSVVKDFTTSVEGWDLQTPIIQEGTLYFTSLAGGSKYAGTVLRVATDGTQFALLKQFTGPDGYYPGSLLLSGAALFGTTGQGGTGNGTVFTIGTNGSGFAVLKQFDGTNGAGPSQLIWSGTRFYGTTAGGGRYGQGTLFEMRSDGSGFAVLESFTGTMGASPSGLALCGSTLFGTTADGGSSGYGVVYSRPLGPLAPVIFLAPRSQQIEKGGTVEFTVEGSGHPYFQWYFNGTNPIPGAIGPRLLLTNVQASQAGGYRVVLSNSVGTATSPVATLTVIPLTITRTPQSQTVEEGGVVEFEVQTVGLAETYHWFFNETNLVEGATNAVLRLDPVRLADQGQYAVVVGNDVGAVTSAPAMLTVIPLGTVPVASCTEAGLRAALAGSEPVTFACDGTIKLDRPISITKDTVMDGRGHSITISGNHAVRVFEVQKNLTLTLANLTIAHGQSTNGGGIYVDGGVLTLLDTTLVANLATNCWGDACGGAIFNAAGVINATNCGFVQNEARGGAGSAATLDPFITNALAGNRGRGGAVFSSGEFNASRCSFVTNQVQGGTGGAGLISFLPLCFGGACGGAGDGGAICNLGRVTIEQSSLAANAAVGGMGGAGAQGGQAFPCDLYLDGTSGGGGGEARGAALSNQGEARLVNCTLAWNAATGGPGAGGAAGGPMYCHGGGVTAGGQGGDGGDGLGATYNENQPLLLLNCTLAGNSSVGGSGGASGGGGYYTYYDPPDNPDPITIIWPAPPAGIDGSGVGGITLSGSVQNTLLASNAPVNCRGTIVDLGHNLGSDDTAAFTNTGSLNNIDPRLGPLGNNGGPTWTMSLLPGSPAIDSGDDAAAPGTDQRGIPRPVGSHSDIGAFEFTAVLQISEGAANPLNILVYGPAGESCTLLTSTTLSDWQRAATNQIGADGKVLFQQEFEAGAAPHFYRVSLPR